MTAPARALLDALTSAGVSLRALPAGGVHWSAPTGAMTPELFAAGDSPANVTPIVA